MGRSFTPSALKGSTKLGWLTEAHNLFAPRCVHKTLHLSPPRAPHAAGRECDPPLSLTGNVWQFYPAPRKQHRAFPEMWRDAHWWVCLSWLRHWPHDFGECGHLQMLWLSQKIPLWVVSPQWTRGHHDHRWVWPDQSLLLSVSQKFWCPVQHQYRERMTGVQRHSQTQEREQTRKRGGVNMEGKRKQSPCHVLRRRHSRWQSEGERTWKNDQWRKMYQSRDPGNSPLRQPTMVG